MIQLKDSLEQVVSRVDTLYINRVDPTYNDSYIQLLEKSNQQLSLVGNPLAWFIGALGVLFAVGAISTAIYILRQSREFRHAQAELLNDLASIRDKYKSDLENLVNSHQEQMKATNQLLNTLVQTGKVADDELQKLRGSIHRSTNAITKASRDIPLSIESIRKGTTKCPNCNRNFAVVFNLDKNIKRGSNEVFKRKCPHCEHLKIIQIKH